MPLQLTPRSSSARPCASQKNLPLQLKLQVSNTFAIEHKAVTGVRAAQHFTVNMLAHHARTRRLQCDCSFAALQPQRLVLVPQTIDTKAFAKRRRRRRRRKWRKFTVEKNRRRAPPLSSAPPPQR